MSPDQPPRVILLPGIGADERLFEPQQPALPGLEVPRWLPHEPHETLVHYAERLAATLTPSERFYLGGASFGGMVAQEIARLLRPAAVLLMATCRHGDAIAPHLKYFVKFAHFLPERTFTWGQSATPLFVSKFGRLTEEQRVWFETMLQDTVPSFVRWGIEAITNWPGCTLDGIPVHQIHGRDAQLIPAANCGADVVVDGAGHLINVTHAETVNAFLAAHVS